MKAIIALLVSVLMPSGAIAAYLSGATYSTAAVAQYPALLSGYSYRPAWSVAGVDFYVGAPASKATKDPATIVVSGVTINTTARSVLITGDNVTLDGYDYTLSGGWYVETHAANTTLSNSKFLAQWTGGSSLIYGTTAASNLVVTNCTIDGNGYDIGGSGAMIAWAGNNITIQYSWMRNAGGDTIQLITGAAVGGSYTLYENLFENGGLVSGAHGDLTQIQGGPSYAHVTYNTTMAIPASSTQGLMTENVYSGEVSHNTFTGSISSFTSADPAHLTGTMSIDNNYFDLTNATSFVYPTTGPNDGYVLTVFTNNINMVTGATVQDTPPGTP